MPTPANPMSQKSQARSPRSSPLRTAAPEVVDPRWILRALLAVLALAAVCAYITVCLVFYRTQWQLVLHPSRTVARTPAALGLRFEAVRFGADASGEPQLSGWWIPAGEPTQPAPATEPTALLLHGGSGTMADALSFAHRLHAAQLNVLLFDYRGFGSSAGAHPEEQTMVKDAHAAVDYLAGTRHIPRTGILPAGEGLGASLAIRLAAADPSFPAVLLESAKGDFAEEARRVTRSQVVPFSLIFHENFAFADPLHTLRTPKLLLSPTAGAPPVEVQRAGDPKMSVEVSPGHEDAVEDSLRRFLDLYVTRPPAQLAPAIAAAP